MLDLLNYRKNVYSENGEDGILDKILEILNINEGYFVEFGAWDGKLGSNTYNLLSKNWKGVYIESLHDRYLECVDNMKPYGDRVKVLNTAISHLDDDNKLDSILLKTSLPKDFDIVSIDIDGYDYFVWKNFIEFKPKIVIIEVDSNIKDGDYQIYDPEKRTGTGYSALCKLGIEKGYKPLVHCANVILLRDDIKFPEVNCYYNSKFVFIQ